MASAEVTDKGIVVTFDASVVIVRGDPDEAAIEVQLAEALEPLGVTVPQFEAVTTVCASWVAHTNRVTKDEELVQVFQWRRGVDATNWRARIS